MGRGASDAVTIELTCEERAELDACQRRRSSTAAQVLRSRIVLLAADGAPNVAIARELGISRPTVSMWRRRFAEDRLLGLTDRPRAGRPAELGPRVLDEVVAATLEPPPPGRAHWTTRTLAAHLGLTQTTVSRAWRSAGLVPREVATWRLTQDPDFTSRVRDVGGVYLDPPERVLALCVDARGRTVAPTVSPLADAARRQPRGGHGLLTALEAAGNLVLASIQAPHRAHMLSRFLHRLDRSVPSSLQLHLVLDSEHTHTTPAIERWLAAHPRFVLRAVPTASAWTQIVAHWVCAWDGAGCPRASRRAARGLAGGVGAWVSSWSEDASPYAWVNTVAGDVRPAADRPGSRPDASQDTCDSPDKARERRI